MHFVPRVNRRWALVPQITSPFPLERVLSYFDLLDRLPAQDCEILDFIRLRILTQSRQAAKAEDKANLTHLFPFCFAAWRLGVSRRVRDYESRQDLRGPHGFRSASSVKSADPLECGFRDWGVK